MLSSSAKAVAAGSALAGVAAYYIMTRSRTHKVARTVEAPPSANNMQPQATPDACQPTTPTQQATPDSSPPATPTQHTTPDASQPATAMLSILPTECLVLVGATLPLLSLGRLCCVSHSFSDAFGTDSSFAIALRATLRDDSLPEPGARAKMLALTQLHCVAWEHQPAAQGAAAAPTPRHHCAAFTHGSSIIVVAGACAPSVQHLSRARTSNTSEAWAYDVAGRRWTRAAAAGERPGPRSYNADVGGCGGVLHDALGQAWAVVFGGSRPGVRDNETWMLGPLGEAAGAASWMWFQIQEDGSAQSDERPAPRFHQTLTVVRDAPAGGGGAKDALMLHGGHNFMISEIEGTHSLTLHSLPLRVERPEGAPPRLAHLDGAAWRELEAVDDGETPPARARHTAVHWAARGYLVLGGEEMLDAWLCRAPLVPEDEGGARWERLPDLPTAVRPDERTLASDAAAVAIDADRLLVVARSVPRRSVFGDFHRRSHSTARPLFLLLEHSPWRWSACSCVGAVPRGVRIGCRLARAASDVCVPRRPRPRTAPPTPAPDGALAPRAPPLPTRASPGVRGSCTGWCCRAVTTARRPTSSTTRPTASTRRTRRE